MDLSRWIVLGCALGLVAWAACDPGEDGCCNSCGRNYYVGEPSVWIANVQEGGNECEIGDVPQEIPDGMNTLVGTVVEGDEPGVGLTDRLEVDEHHPGDMTEPACEGLDVFTAQEFTEASVSPGARVCIVDEVTTEELCTQKSCPEGLSCRVHPRR